MATTLEDLDRRVAALEKAAESEQSIVRAVSDIVAESETRIKAMVSATEQRLSDRMDGLSDRMDATERRIIDVVNDKFDAVMAALDRLTNPPQGT